MDFYVGITNLPDGWWWKKIWRRVEMKNFLEGTGGDRNFFDGDGWEWVQTVREWVGYNLQPHAAL